MKLKIFECLGFSMVERNKEKLTTPSPAIAKPEKSWKNYLLKKKCENQNIITASLKKKTDIRSIDFKESR